MARGFRNRVAGALSGLSRVIQRADASAGPIDLLQQAAVRSSYEAASQSRRMSPWQPNRLHINAALASEGPLLRARSRQVIANAAYGANASETFVCYAVGPGIKPSSLILDEQQRGEVSLAFTDWTDEADADGITDFYGLQSLVSRALFDAGECFVRLRARYAADGLSVPLQLQLIEAEQLDQSMTMPGPGGNIIRQGIEFDPIGRRVAYYFWPTNPGDYTSFLPPASSLSLGDKVRVPAETVLHIFKPLRPGQIRGRPWMTPGLVKLHDLDEYDDAELSRKKTAAMFAAFLTRTPGDDAPGSLLADGSTPTSPDGSIEVYLEPATIQPLLEGGDIKFAEPADVGPNYEAFQYRSLAGLCAALGLPYHAVTSDVSRANYSSLRASLVEARRRIEQFQWETLIFQFCRPVWINWLDAAVSSGAVSLPGYARNPLQFRRVKWLPPRWDWVDPLKDVQAEKLMVDSGFKSRSDVIEERGEDPVETDLRIAADRQREIELGLSFAVGYSKSPDPPMGTDVPQPSATAGEVPPTPEPAPTTEPAATPAAAGNDYLEQFERLLKAQPAPVINVHPQPRYARGTVEKTVVTKHDSKGRIKEFERRIG
jgi:lambda family phage portal protein